MPCGDVGSRTRTPRTNLRWVARLLIRHATIYSVLLPRMAAKIPVEPWKARPGMHASLCHKLRPGALRTSYFRTTEPNKICRFRCTSQDSATSHPKLTLASIVTMIQFSTNLICFYCETNICPFCKKIQHFLHMGCKFIAVSVSDKKRQAHPVVRANGICLTFFFTALVQAYVPFWTKQMPERSLQGQE